MRRSAKFDVLMWSLVAALDTVILAPYFPLFVSYSVLIVAFIAAASAVMGAWD